MNQYAPFSILRLTPGQIPELLELEQHYLREIGEEPMTPEAGQRLGLAIQEERIVFFAAVVENRPVGMCSVARHFSTFTCGDTAVLEDVYLLPEYRHKGLARALTRTAGDWCRQQGLASLTVCCAPCDLEMYRSLGFDAPLGTTLAMILQAP